MMSAVPPAALRDELVARIRSGVEAPLGDSDFDYLARAIYAYQYAANTAYRAFCDSRRKSPAIVRSWLEIPAVPTSAFKAVPLICGSPEDAVAIFRTSGTTAGADRRGAHYLPDLALYDASLRAGFAAHLLPDGARIPVFSLIADPKDAPDSSLSHMANAVIDEFGSPASGSFVSPAGLAVPSLLEAFDGAERAGTPVCILATSLALLHLLDVLDSGARRYALPPGARLMDTGGFKGRPREITRDELYTRARDRLGIPAEWCVNEYGMTEMGSQFYDTRAGDPAGNVVAARRYHGPPWVRTRAVDPETLEILPDGEVGILRHWDLANLGSVMVLQTEDLGICEESGFRLLGRAAGAEPRGCSLATEELLRAVGRGR